MASENTELFNPIHNLIYSSILSQFTHHVARSLGYRYTELGGKTADLYDYPPPVDQPGPPEAYMEKYAVITDGLAFSSLFLYHFTSFSTLPEMSEEEVAWVWPTLEAALSGVECTLYLDIPKLSYLLWLYERKRLPLDLHNLLVAHFVRLYQENQQDVLFRISDPEKSIDTWNAAFAALVEANRAVAEENEEKRRLKWEETQAELHAELLEKQAKKQAEFEKRRGEEARDRAGAAFAADLVSRYAADPAAFAHRFTLPADHPEVREVITGYNLRGVLDDQGTLWVSGKGRLGRTFLSRLSDEGWSGILTVILEEGIVHLDDLAFYREEPLGLAAIHLPKSLRSIRQSAFSYCTKLCHLVLPENLRYIGPLAFEGCRALTGLSLPNSLTTLSANALEATGLANAPKLPPWCRLVLYRDPVTNCDGKLLFPSNNPLFFWSEK